MYLSLCTAQACTDASVHDSQMLEAVLRGPKAGGEGVWADSAYRSEAQERRLAEGGHRSQIHERAHLFCVPWAAATSFVRP